MAFEAAMVHDYGFEFLVGILSIRVFRGNIFERRTDQFFVNGMAGFLVVSCGI